MILAWVLSIGGVIVILITDSMKKRFWRNQLQVFGMVAIYYGGYLSGRIS